MLMRTVHCFRTGWGHHGDYLFGWEGDSLQRAMDVCIDPSGRPADCASQLTLQTDEEMNACTLPPMVDEKVEGECEFFCVPLGSNVCRGGQHSDVGSAA